MSLTCQPDTLEPAVPLLTTLLGVLLFSSLNATSDLYHKVKVADGK